MNEAKRLAWHEQLCAQERLKLRELQQQRAQGVDPRHWLIPEELRQWYGDEQLVHVLFDSATAALRTMEEPPADVASRERVLIRLAVFVLEDRKRLLKELQRMYEQRAPEPIKLPDGSTVRYVGPRR